MYTFKTMAHDFTVLLRMSLTGHCPFVILYLAGTETK